MRHRKQGRKLGRKSDSRRALLKGLAVALILNESIKTTQAKAKELRPFLERIISFGKKGDLASRRKILSLLANNEKATKKVIEELGPRYKERRGGYIRIIKISPRKNDAALMAKIELVEENQKSRTKADNKK